MHVLFYITANTRNVPMPMPSQDDVDNYQQRREKERSLIANACVVLHTMLGKGLFSYRDMTPPPLGSVEIYRVSGGRFMFLNTIIPKSNKRCGGRVASLESGEHRAFAIEAFFKSNDSCVIARRQFCLRFGIRRISDGPSVNLIHSGVQRFRASASALNTSRPGPSRS